MYGGHKRYETPSKSAKGVIAKHWNPFMIGLPIHKLETVYTYCFGGNVLPLLLLHILALLSVYRLSSLLTHIIVLSHTIANNVKS
jgi:hypothetical protein